MRYALIRSDPTTPDGTKDQGGSALVLAMFVLVLLAGTGVALMYLAGASMDMSQASLHAKQAFYMAEAGLEDGRARLRSMQWDSVSDELLTAAGDNGVIDFDATALDPTFDSGGILIGLTGYDDDVPLRGKTLLDDDESSDEFYASFLTNDPVEGTTNLTDLDGRLMITSVGTGPENSLEMVQAIVEPVFLLPSYPPCDIMLVGPDPDFHGGEATCSGSPNAGDDESSDESSDEASDDQVCICHVPGGDADKAHTICIDAPAVANHVAHGDSEEACDGGTDSDSGTWAGKTFDGTDCGGGGVAGLYVPAVCVAGSDAELLAETGMGTCSNEYVSAGFGGNDTVADMDDPLDEPTLGAGNEIDPAWQDCATLATMVEESREIADFSCSGSCSATAGSDWDGGAAPSLTPTSITFVDGDLTVGSLYDGKGLLVVTGTVYFDTSASWDGLMLVIGQGRFLRQGTGGSGTLTGATIVANIAGPDFVYGTDDDCDYLLAGSGDDEGEDEDSDSPAIGEGLGTAVYHEADQQAGDTVYCTDSINPANPIRSVEIVQFRQR